MTDVTWDIGSTANVTLDSTALVATVSGSGGIRATSGQASGKFYYEVTITTLPSGPFIGLLKSSSPTTAAGYSSGANVGVGVASNVLKVLGSTVGSSLGTAASGTVVCLAIDMDNQRAWARYGAAGNWNGSSANSPTTPSTGASFAGLGSNGISLLPVVGATGSGVFTANFGQNAFTGTVPTGFTSGFPTGGTDNVLVTQVGSEVWATNPSIVRVTQIGSEVWVNPIAPLRVSQAGVEVWSVNTPALRISQTGVEVWVSVAVGATPNPGSLVFTGFAPILPVSASPASGAITFTGYAPSADEAMAPAAGAILITGYAPSVATNISSTPAAGAILLTGYAPSPVVNAASAPASGAITLAGYAPSPVVNAASAPASGAITLAGYAPSPVVNAASAPASGAITLAGYAPVNAMTTAAAAGAILLTGYAPMSIASGPQSGESLGAWRGIVGVNWLGMSLVGDAFSGVVGLSDFGSFTEYGQTQKMVITSPPIHQDRKRIFVRRFELDVECATANDAAPNPQLHLDWSKDGGETWEPLMIARSMGEVGEYTQRLRWLSLGESRSWVFRVTVSDPVRRTIIGSYVDLAAGIG